MQVRRAFRANVLIYGRLWLRRPLLWSFGAPSSFWAFVAPSSSSKCVCVSVASIRRPGTMLLSMDVDGSVILFHGVFFFRSPVAEKPRIPPRARGNTAALPIPRQRYRFRDNASLEGVSGQRPHMGVCCSVVLVQGGLCLRSLWETLPSVCRCCWSICVRLWRKVSSVSTLLRMKSSLRTPCSSCC